jgi:hypothetical protein
MFFGGSYGGYGRGGYGRGGYGGGFGGGFGGGWGGDGIDRSGWATKSGAALNRENKAKELFRDFLLACQAKPKAAFPLTEEVVPCKVHLTGECWKAFKRSVVAQGCTARRREATTQERIASKDKRKSKMYVISVTCPVHPGAAIEAAAAAKAAAKLRADKARAEADARAAALKAKMARDAAFQARADAEFEKVAARLREDAETAPPSPGSLGKRKRQNEEAAASAAGGAAAIPRQFLERAEQTAYKRQKVLLDQQFDQERRDLLKMWGERKVEAEKLLRAETTRAKMVLLAEQHVIE